MNNKIDDKKIDILVETVLTSVRGDVANDFEYNRGANGKKYIPFDMARDVLEDAYGQCAPDDMGEDDLDRDKITQYVKCIVNVVEDERGLQLSLRHTLNLYIRLFDLDLSIKEEQATQWDMHTRYQTLRTAYLNELIDRECQFRGIK